MKSYVALLIDSTLRENPDYLNGSNVAPFFGNENPEYIGFVGGLSAHSNEVLLL
jgi:hypothetical protein